MDLFCFSVESSSVQVFFFGGREKLGEPLTTAVLLKPEQMTGPKDMQNTTNFLRKVILPHYIHKSRRFGRKTVEGMAQRPFASPKWGFNFVACFPSPKSGAVWLVGSLPVF